MRLGQDVLSDLGAALTREWLVADGLGGSACGTVAGAHTRRTHALLTAADPRGRPTVALLKLDERLHAGAEVFELSCNLYAGPSPEAARENGGRFHARPAGHLLLEEFCADPWPTWRWRAGGVTLEKSLFMVHGHHAVVVVYRHLDGPPARLTVSALLPAPAHDVPRGEGRSPLVAAQVVPGRVRIQAGDAAPPLTLWHSGAFLPARVWQRGLAYPGDPAWEPPPAAARAPSHNGLDAAAWAEHPIVARAPTPENGALEGDAAEAAFVPGYLEGPLPVGGALHLVASTEEDLFRALAMEGRLGAPPPRTLAECCALLARGEQDRLAGWRRAAVTGADVTAREAATAHGGPGEALADRGTPLVDEDDPWVAHLARALADGLVVRGGRTTLLTELPAGPERGADTLRALPALITLRAFDPAREVLCGYVEYLNEGLAPEGFSPDDGRPLYGDPAASLWLVHAAELLARRSEDLDLVRAALYPAVVSIMHAYRSGTRGGIRVGSDGLLTCGVGNAAATRADLNALWFHALVATAQLARMAGRKEEGAFYLAWARQHQTRLREAFWDERHGCLFDTLTPAGTRPGLSPAQLLAVCLTPPCLSAERPLRLVAALERELFTPWGLRESPGAQAVSPVWLGAFITAYLRVHQRSPESQGRVRGWLATLRAALEQRAVTHLPESWSPAVRPAAAPRFSPSAPASVLAAAELLRAWVEEVGRAERTAGVA